MWVFTIQNMEVMIENVRILYTVHLEYEINNSKIRLMKKKREKDRLAS